MLFKDKNILGVLPAFLLVGILFFGGIFEGIMESVKTLDGAYTLKFYKEVLMEQGFRDSFCFTLKVAIISTAVTIILGLIIAYCLFMVSQKNLKNILKVQRLLQIPMLFPYLVASYMMSLMFMQSGWISRVMFHMKWIKDMTQFPILVNDPVGIGIMITYIYKATPFVVLMMTPILLKIEKEWIQVGQVFGCKDYQFFKCVVLPLLYDPLKVAFIMIFSYTFLCVEVPYILGATYPKALSVYSYDMYMESFLKRPMAMAINVMMMLFVLFIGWMVKRNGVKKYEK